MHEKCFYVDASCFTCGGIHLEGSDVDYILHTLRKKVGDTIRCKSHNNEILHGIITKTGKHSLDLTVERATPISQSKKAHTTCLLAVPHPGIFSSIVARGSELGLDLLIPVLTERSFIQTSQRFDLPYFRRLAKENGKQCGRETALEIKPPRPIDRLHRDISVRKIIEGATNIFPWEGENERHLLDLPPPKSRVCFFIGPEGGLPISEADRIKALGFERCGLGENILKVETAFLMTLIGITLLAWGKNSKQMKT